MTLLVLGIIFLIAAFIVLLYGAKVGTDNLEMGNAIVALIFIAISATLGFTGGILILLGILLALL